MKILNFLHIFGLIFGAVETENATERSVGRSREFNEPRRELKWNYYDSYNEIVGNSAPKGKFQQFNSLTLFIIKHIYLFYI